VTLKPKQVETNETCSAHYKEKKRVWGGKNLTRRGAPIRKNEGGEEESTGPTKGGGIEGITPSVKTHTS